jgi:arylsulfatase A-like enzyme
LLANAFTDTHRCIRNQRYKLIEYNIEGQRSTQLFDLQHDPWETQNLAEDPSMNRIIESLRTELKLWQKEQGDDADWV